MGKNILNFTSLALPILVFMFCLSIEAPAVIDCDCDLAIDEYVDVNDLGVLVDNWLAVCSIEDCNGSDLDDTGSIDFDDFAYLAQYWMTDLAGSDCLWLFIQQQLENTMTELDTNPIYSGGYDWPRATDEDGIWIPKYKGTWGHWACGFIPGSLWYLYDKTGDTMFRTWAEDRTAQLVNNRYRTHDHESGFIIYRSYGFGYQLTGNSSYKPVILDATEYMLTRYNSTVGCIRSWNSYTFPVITDGLMMLEMVFWAVNNGGDPDWYDMAVTHATKTMQNNVRPNGSTWQIVDYNPSTGAVIGKYNKQGYNNDSTWSRGQAWGINGFTMVYRETNDPNFLNTAKKVADYFIDHLPDDYVPYWDFNAPDYPDAENIKDSSASAIAASGLLELSTHVSSQPDKEKYYNAACDILDSLSSSDFLAKNSNSMGVLLHGTGRGNPTNPDPTTWEKDCSLMYGDHFFIEALMRKEQITPP